MVDKTEDFLLSIKINDPGSGVDLKTSSEPEECQVQRSSRAGQVHMARDFIQKGHYLLSSTEKAIGSWV